MGFATWVRDTRSARNMTQTECAARAGMKLQQWNQIEKQVKNPERATVEKIADALGVSRKEALAAAGYQTDPASQSLLRAELEAFCDKVPPARQAGFLRAVRSMADAVSI